MKMHGHPETFRLLNLFVVHRVRKSDLKYRKFKFFDRFSEVDVGMCYSLKIHSLKVVYFYVR